MKNKVTIVIFAIILLSAAIYFSFYQKKYEGHEIFSENIKADDILLLTFSADYKAKEFKPEDGKRLIDLLRKAKYTDLGNKKSHSYKFGYQVTAREGQEKYYIITIYDNAVVEFHESYPQNATGWYSVDQGLEEILELCRQYYP